MSKHTIKYYPVGNGDTSLITLTDGATILIDCKIRASAEGDADDTKFDVKADLLKSIKKRSDGAPFIDSFILTHPDQDHCLGFESHFYQGDPKLYSKQHRDKGQILIEELCYTPRIIANYKGCNDDLCADATAFKKEALRRYNLHKNNHSDKNLPGNRIIIIGYGKHLDLTGLEAISYTAGSIIERINGSQRPTFSFFVHAPFSEDLPSADKNSNDQVEKNGTSVVLQARFKHNSYSTDFACLAMFGGDSDHYIWGKVLSKSTAMGNTTALDWDLFLAPHHTSWTYFNDTPQSKNTTPKQSSLDILDKRRDGARVISQSKPIKNDDKNPPHFEAKQEYVKKVGSANFINAGEHPNETAPSPIVFEVTPQGPIKLKVEGLAIVSAGGGLAAANSVTKYGSEPTQ